MNYCRNDKVYEHYPVNRSRDQFTGPTRSENEMYSREFGDLYVITGRGVHFFKYIIGNIHNIHTSMI